MQAARAAADCFIAPDAFRKGLGGHHVAAGDDQRRQGGSLAPPAQIDNGAVPDGVERAKHPQRQPAGFVHRRSRSPSWSRSLRINDRHAKYFPRQHEGPIC